MLKPLLLVSGINTRLTKIRKQNLLTFNEIAGEYHYRRRSPWNECIVPLIVLGADSLVLDAGAGTGRQSLELGQLGFNVIAVDFSANMLKQLKTDAANSSLDGRITPLSADIVALPFRDDVFNGIEMVAALHHVPSKQLRISAMQEIFRVTKGGGHAVISVWFRGQRGFYPKLLANASRVLFGSEWGDVWIPWGGRPRFYHLFGKRELRSLVSLSGFSVDALSVTTFGGQDSEGLNRNILLNASKI